jgi:hypothetical protein
MGQLFCHIGPEFPLNGEFSTDATMIAPCSVKAWESFRRPPQVKLDIANCDFIIGVAAVIDDEQLTAGQAGAVWHRWRSPVPIVGPLKQNKIKKSKGFALKGYRGRGYFPAGPVPGGLGDGLSGSKGKAPARKAFPLLSEISV